MYISIQHIHAYDITYEYDYYVLRPFDLIIQVQTRNHKF